MSPATHAKKGSKASPINSHQEKLLVTLAGITLVSEWHTCKLQYSSKFLD